MEKKPLNFIMRYINIFKIYFLMILTFITLAQVVGQAYPYFLAKIYDTVSGKIGDPAYWDNIVFYTVIACAASLFKSVLFQVSDLMVAIFLPKSGSLIAKDVFDYVNKHSISYFSKEMSGNISGKMDILVNNTTELLGQVHWMGHSIITLVVSMVYLSIVNLVYLPIMSIWFLLVVLIGYKLGKWRRRLAKETSKMKSTTTGMVVDALSNYSEIKSFANFKFERLNLLKTLRMLRTADTKERKAMSYIHSLLQVTSTLSMVGFLFFSIYILKTGSIDTTEFIFANTLFATVGSMVFQVSWSYSHLARIFGNISSALDTLSVAPEIVDAPDAKKLTIKKAAITFDDVSFGYENRNTLFAHLSLKIEAGEKIGLVGSSGAGKSTFIKLISRYYDIDSGSIKINNQDIRDVTQDSLHKNIAVIPQDVSLFNRTLFDNIRYGRTNATEEEVCEAAKKAYANNFINEFEHGFQTKVGDRGVILSGGERQRIAIARAILKNAPILVFDEATSALDSTSEKHIQKSLKTLMKGKTVIAIAHRLSTLREMDRILVFEKGQLIEEGSHASLLRKKGTYRKLYKTQTDGFMGE